MNWKSWKMGVLVALLLSLLVAGSGLAVGEKWQVFVSVFCTAALTHLGAFLYQHPVDSIKDNGPEPPGGSAQPQQQPAKPTV